MHPEDIKAALRKVHGTVKAFEVAKGLPVDAVRDVLRGKASRRTAEAIAECLGKPIKTLFPGRFGDRNRDHISRKRESHRLSRTAN